MKATSRKLAECMKCHYPVEVVRCEDGCYFVRLPDLPGCMSQGETVEGALANIEEAKELWLEGALKARRKIPAPGRPPRTSAGTGKKKSPASRTASGRRATGKRRTRPRHQRS